ncbi:MAG: DUF2807 domain-containing protein [Flavobacteriales bacterium]|nr:DUF2807 domain-containing protein [Flavobacteriales bacterium]
MRPMIGRAFPSTVLTMNTMRLSFTLPALIASVAFISACTPWDCEKGAGAPVKQPLAVATFHGIVVEGSLEVRLSRSDAQQVDAEGQANLIALITTEVKNGVWHIGTKRCYSTDKPFIVHIAVPTLDLVSVQGSGDVKGDDTFTMDEIDLEVQGSGELRLAVAAKTVRATVQGSGDIDLKGTCASLNASVQGSGDIDAGGLKATSGKAEVAGSGDITVEAVEVLDASIAGSGDINYRGDPAKVNKNIAGSGDIKQVK